MRTVLDRRTRNGETRDGNAETTDGTSTISVVTRLFKEKPGKQLTNNVGLKLPEKK